MTQDDLLAQAQVLRKRSEAYDVPLPESRQTGLHQSTLTIDVADQAPVKLYIYAPSYLSSQGVILNFRGSGFMYPWTQGDFAFAKSLVFATNYTVVDVDYPVAPEHPFPAAVDAAFGAYVYVLEHFSSFAPLGHPLIVMGHSAGGNLAVTTQL